MPTFEQWGIDQLGLMVDLVALGFDSVLWLWLMQFLLVSWLARHIKLRCIMARCAGLLSVVPFFHDPHYHLLTPCSTFSIHTTCSTISALLAQLARSLNFACTLNASSLIYSYPR